MNGEYKMTTEIERWRSFLPRPTSFLIFSYFITHCHDVIQELPFSCLTLSITCFPFVVFSPSFIMGAIPTLPQLYSITCLQVVHSRLISLRKDKHSLIYYFIHITMFLLRRFFNFDPVYSI